MNELELVGRLRSEVPFESSAAVEEKVRAAVEASPGKRRGSPRWMGSSRLQPALAGGLAVVIAAGVFSAVQLSRSSAARLQTGPQVVAWSGQPTAAWPATQPSYGHASSAPELVDYATRSAATAPGRAPRPDEWVVVKQEYAQSSSGSGGFLFGPPDERDVSVSWIRGDGCASASIPSVPADLPPSTTVNGQLSINNHGVFLPPCDGATLGGWKSVTYSYLDSLPTDPAALEAVIVANNPPGPGVPTRQAAIFEAIDTLFSAGAQQGIIIPAKLTASLYRVLQQLPGAHFESAVDLAGRTGLGFFMVTEGYLKEEIVIDPMTYAYMGYEDVAVADHALTGTDGTRYVEKGHVMGWGALLGSAIVKHPGQLP